MISRITKKKEGTHSSPNGKSSGLNSLNRKPSPYVELPRRVTIPLVIRTNRPTHQATIVEVLEKPRQWHTKQNPTIQPTDRECNMHICQWYRKKRAAKQLAQYHKKEKERAVKERLAKERADIEHRALEHFKMRALHKQYEIPTPKSSTKIEQSPQTKKKLLEKQKKELEKQALKEKADIEHFKMREKRKYKFATPKSSSNSELSPKTKKRLEKERKELEKQAFKHFQIQESFRAETPKKTKVAKKTAYAKPRTETRAVKEKRLRRYDDIGVRFTNCVYRICCQLYCCVTCILIVGFVIVIL